MIGEAALYPALVPRQSGFLDRPGGHRLYWEDCGNPDGVPVIYLHGGPGAGISPMARRFFDPAFYRVILMDQRGAGRSTPAASLQQNTTWDLVADLEAVRQDRGIGQWLVFGGSWGSTLALAYGQSHADRCLGFILRGIFLCREMEIDWFLTGMGRFRPRAAKRFYDVIGMRDGGEWREILSRYSAALTSEDPEERLRAARAWSAYETACCTLIPEGALTAHAEEAAAALALARLEAHYFVHRGFFEPNQLLRDMDKIAHLPAIIVQGMHDLVCPPETAEALHQAWPGSDFVAVADGSHSALDPSIARELVSATNRFRNQP